MNDLIAYRTLDPLTMTELSTLERTAARHWQLVRERDHLVGLMFLAVRTGNTELKATTRKRLADVEAECNKCYATLRGGGRQAMSEAA